jgi:hypothetical protein
MIAICRRATQNAIMNIAQLVRVLGEIWLSLLSLFVVIFGLIIIVTEGFRAFWAVFSPFHIWNWGLVLILALPGIGLLVLAKRLRK